MSLSSDVLAQFVKATKDDTKSKKETTVYGTTVEYSGETFVRLDGSDLLTPISKTTNANPGERVTVMIKDHTATITGNISSPSARTDDVEDLGTQISEFEIIIADKVSVKEFDAQNGRIDSLVSDNVLIRGELTANKADITELRAADATITGTLTANKALIDNLEASKLSVDLAAIKYATIEDLTATEIDVRDLEATFGDFEVLSTDKFDAIDATIKELDAEKISASDIEGKFANIDFANIGELAVQNLFAKSGMVDDLVMSNGAITGTLVGVTIKGDLIEGGTIAADKLIIKGTDGLYYQLNTDGETVETKQTDYNSLNGSIITAQSITANKIVVDDLVAFGATIGGFKITDNAIHSVVKTAVNNTTRGIYMDNGGQMAIGDASNYLKYYQDTDGKYKLAISAASILLSSSSKSIETMLNDMQADLDNIEGVSGAGIADLVTRIQTAEASIKQNADNILLKAGRAEVESTLAGFYTKEQTEAAINVASNHITSTVSSTYATKTDATAAQNAANQAKANATAAQNAADLATLNAANAQDAANNAQDSADEAYKTAADASGRVTVAESSIQQLADMIATLVTDGNGTSLMTQTATGWQFSIGSFADTLSSTSKGLNDLSETVGDTNNALNTVKQAVNDLGVLADYVIITTYNDQPCIEIGEGDNDFKLRITNTAIHFADGSIIPAYISNQKMYIKNAEVTDELQFGGFAWKKRSNGNMGLIWKGES